MREQEYIIKNIDSFEPKHIFECGQCFRWNMETDGSYTGVVKHNVLNVKKIDSNIIIKGFCNDNIREICNEYFDLETNYENIKKILSNVDKDLEESIKYGSGIRILKQDEWEALISFIISANNNIPRIKGIIERISKKYGTEMKWNNKSYYTFPTPKELSKATIKDLRILGLGFRDSRVFETTKMIVNREIDLYYLKDLEDINIIREQLLKCSGVGPKVADCIMLFSMKKYEVFPIDVWVKRVMTELYVEEKYDSLKKNITLDNKIIGLESLSDPKKISNKQILEIAEKKFGKLAGLAQQYLFYWRRKK